MTFPNMLEPQTPPETISSRITNGNTSLSKKNVDMAKSKNVAKSELFLIKLPGPAY